MEEKNAYQRPERRKLIIVVYVSGIEAVQELLHKIFPKCYKYVVLKICILAQVKKLFYSIILIESD